MKRGDICWYKFKAPDKNRPVLILTRESILAHLGEVTIAPVTSTVRNIPSELYLPKELGMKTDCAINFDHIQTVSKRKIGKLIITLPSDKLDQVRQAICFALDL